MNASSAAQGSAGLGGKAVWLEEAAVVEQPLSSARQKNFRLRNLKSANVLEGVN